MVPLTVPVSNHNDFGAPGGWIFEVFPRYSFPWNRMEHLSLADDGLDNDPVFSYTPTQLSHYEVAQGLLTNPLPEGMRHRSRLVGVKTHCSMLMSSTMLGLKPERRWTPAYHMHKWSTLLHLSSWTPASQNSP
jgi:hypothetical protein